MSLRHGALGQLQFNVMMMSVGKDGLDRPGTVQEAAV